MSPTSPSPRPTPSSKGPASKGKGFRQPSGPHRHWQIDITYPNLSGTFHFLCTVPDRHSRAILAWDMAPP
ncbi:MAG: hypothetical protein R3F11_07235 [Verrucomicrobiales bacterium]